MFDLFLKRKRQLKGKKLHVNWIPFGDKTMGSSRTNVWDVHDELMEFDSVISTINGDDWDSYDVTIFQKKYEKELFKFVKKKCLVGFSVGDTHMIFKEGIKKSDFVLCSCQALKQEIEKLNKRCHVIIEGEKLERYSQKKDMTDEDEIVLLYHGFKENIVHLNGNVATAVNNLVVNNKKIIVKIISNFPDTVSIPFFSVPIILCRWNLETFSDDVLSADIGIIPQGDGPEFRLKSANKIRTLMAMRIPVIGDGRNQDFQDTVGHNAYGLLAKSQEEWETALQTLITDFNKRRYLADAGYKRILEHYTTKVAAQQLVDVLQGYFKTS